MICAAVTMGSVPAQGCEPWDWTPFTWIRKSSTAARKPPARQPTADQEAAAGLMLTAMLQAAKADGRFDRDEQAKLMEKLGDVSREERDFVNATLQKPVDIDGLARAVPRGMEPQVYMMSVLGIDLDSQEEAQYLHNLAKAMGIDKANVNHIHDRMGVPRIYR